LKIIEISTVPGISSISAGFPSPAEDFSELSISLDKHLIQNPSATFMAYANGNSMVDAGIHHGDILIIDRSLNARDGDIIIAVLHGEFTVKQLSIVKDTFFLVPKNSQYSPVKISDDMDFEIWGVVIYSIRKHR
jgi:DNA polymerase V